MPDIHVVERKKHREGGGWRGGGGTENKERKTEKFFFFFWFLFFDFSIFFSFLENKIRNEKEKQSLRAPQFNCLDLSAGFKYFVECGLLKGCSIRPFFVIFHRNLSYLILLSRLLIPGLLALALVLLLARVIITYDTFAVESGRRQLIDISGPVA